MLYSSMTWEIREDTMSSPRQTGQNGVTTSAEND